MAVSPEEYVEVDLDSLTIEELIREKDAVKTAIVEITQQLRDPTRRPREPEDDSPVWDAYRAWRRSARAALAYREKERIDIKAVLRERHDTATAGRRLRMAHLCPDQPASEAEVLAARTQRLIDAIADQTPDMLLLRAYRAIRNLIGVDGQELPDTLDDEDRDTLTLLAIRLRETFGKTSVNRYCKEPPHA